MKQRKALKREDIQEVLKDKYMIEIETGGIFQMALHMRNTKA